MICNIVERAGIEPATLTRVRPAFPLSYLPIYPLIAGIARPAHTTLRKGISTSFPCIFRHIHGACCAGAGFFSYASYRAAYVRLAEGSCPAPPSFANE